jgi:hypothetical protein
MEEYIEQLLYSSLDYGIKEIDFWEMTIGEVIRQIESYRRVQKIQHQEKATYDYLLAGLIVKGVSISLGSKEEYPTLQEAYPGIFDDVAQAQKEKIEEQKVNLSALRFRQFAQSYNSKYK